jgi:hypothetical protein
MERYIINYSETEYIGSEEREIEDFVEDIFFTIRNLYNEKIGEGHFKIINFSEFEDYYLEETCYLMDLLDLDNQILNFFEYIGTPELFNSDYYDIDFFEPFFQKKFKNRRLYNSRVGYLDTIKINEDYQGQNIGSLVLTDLKYRYGYSLDFIGVKPYPLEFQDLSKKDFVKKDFDLKKKKVVNFYKKNGYKKIVKSDFYVLIL